VEAPLLPRQALIDARGDGGFRFAGILHRGSTTGAAVRTHNVMLMERRRVGAGLIVV
jgi:uncharacterized protein